MRQIEYIHYDENIDHLTIYEANEEIESTVDIGYVLVSLNKRGDVVGLEFKGINKNLHMPKKVLRNITGCKVRVQYDPSDDMVIISVFLEHNKNEYPVVYSSHEHLGSTPFDMLLEATTAS